MNGSRAYEALIIVKAAGTEQEVARVASQLEEVVKRLGGTLQASQSMGRRRLAFRIARQTEGHYHLLRFAAPTGQIVEMERQFRLNEAVVRFVVLAQEDGEPAAKPAGSAERGERVERSS